MSSPIYTSGDRGRGVARYAHALLQTPNGLLLSLGDSRPQVGECSAVVTCLKVAAASGTTPDARWAGVLSDYATSTPEFLALLQPRSILGQLQPALRQVPLAT